MKIETSYLVIYSYISHSREKEYPDQVYWSGISLETAIEKYDFVESDFKRRTGSYVLTALRIVKRMIITADKPVKTWNPEQ